MGKEPCGVSLRCLTVGSRVEVCPMPRFIIRLRARESLRMLFLQTSLLKASIKPEDGMSFLFFGYFCWFYFKSDNRLGAKNWKVVRNVFKS